MTGFVTSEVASTPLRGCMTVRLLVFRDRLVGIDPSLFYKGKEYPISVNGLSLGKVGVSGSSATGKGVQS